jgi:hypothetical protein
MPRRIKHPKAPSRVVAIVQERRAAQAVEEALAQERIAEIDLMAQPPQPAADPQDGGREDRPKPPVTRTGKQAESNRPNRTFRAPSA